MHSHHSKTRVLLGAILLAFQPACVTTTTETTGAAGAAGAAGVGAGGSGGSGDAGSAGQSGGDPGGQAGAAGDAGASGEAGAAGQAGAGGSSGAAGAAGDAGSGGAAAGSAGAGGSAGGAAGSAGAAGQGEASPWGPGVLLVKLDANGEAVIDADLSQGAEVADLSWASSSSVACFPATKNLYFKGNHVMFALADQLPPRATLDITAEPDPGVEVSLYALQTGKTNYYVPPYAPSAVACEASYSLSLSDTPNPGVAEAVHLENPTSNTYNALWGVAGDGATGKSGAFKVRVKLVADDTTACYQKPAAAPKDWASSVRFVDLDENGEAELAGDLGDGAPVCDLSFAQDGQIACFPETQFDHFRGNHVFYALRDGQPAKSKVTITVAPEPGTEANLYGYRMSTTSFYVPPYVPSVNTCEASFPATLSGAPNPGEPETILFSNPGANPYNLFFAVAGDKDTGASGAYKVKVKVQKAAESSCGDALLNPPASNKWPSSVTQVAVDAQGVGKVSSDLSAGAKVCDLSFASSSQVACFPATSVEYFKGNQRFFALKDPMPPQSKVTITAKPGAGVDVNLYGYMIGTTSFHVPPYVPSAVTCEAGFNASLSGASNPGEPESISFSNPTGNPYNLLFAVAGFGDAGTAGAFDVDVKVETAGPPFCPGSLPGAEYATWPASVELLPLAPDNTAKTSGDLASGACANLGFADDSDVACFPSTEFNNFTGNQRFYALADVLPPGASLKVTATPAPGVDVSLYGYQIGAKSYYVPPHVPQAVACEASHGKQAPNPGEPETITFSNPTGNPYHVFVAVAGADGAASGAYDLAVELTPPAAPFCPESLPGAPGSAWPASLKLLTLDASGAAKAQGDLSAGSCKNLSFASESDVACFPATQAQHFKGNQVLYALDAPVPAGKKILATVTPQSGVDVSLYGYLQGAASFATPPALPSALSCEASHSKALDGSGNPGEKESISLSTGAAGGPYNLVLAVSGAQAVNAGSYTLDVAIIDGP